VGLSIGGTTAALTAHRHVTTAQRDLGRSVERLSSGLRINRAADDAAGLAMSQGLRSRAGGLAVAVRNAHDAISLVQTGEGALAATHEILHRMRDLTVRAASSGTVGATARAAVSEEVRALQDQLDEVATGTRSGGRALLDGAFLGTFQVGAGAGDTLAIGIGADLGAVGLGVRALSLGAGLAGVVSTPGKADFGGRPGTPSEHHLDLADDADVRRLVQGLADPSAGVQVNGTVVDLSGVSTRDQLVTALTGAGGVRATLTATGLTLTAGTTGPDPIVLTGLDGVAGVAVPGTADVPDSGGHPAALTATVDLAELGGSIRLGSGLSFDLATVSAAIDAQEPAHRAGALRSALESAFAGAAVTVTDDGTVTITAGAPSDDAFTVRRSATDLTLDALDRAIGTVATARAGLGAAQNRLEHVLAVQGVALENVVAAASRIRDADMAAETAAMTRASILRQAGTAMLGQASTAPRQLLTLLQP
jgi:flagellin